MCGRFTVTAEGDVVKTDFGLLEVPEGYEPRFNVAPMQAVLAVIHDGTRPRAGWMRWGLVPSWATDPAIGARMINARSETIDQKSAFREAFEKRRCLIVADGFYEWQHIRNIKVPMRIRLRGGRPFAFAGLWERWSRGTAEPLVTCTILTTTPSPSIESIHDRMPVILRPEDYSRWLSRDVDPDSLKPLLRAYDDEDLESYSVSTLVNHAGNDVPECIEPADPPAATLDKQTTLF